MHRGREKVRSRLITLPYGGPINPNFSRTNYVLGSEPSLAPSRPCSHPVDQGIHRWFDGGKHRDSTEPTRVGGYINKMSFLKPERRHASPIRDRRQIQYFDPICLPKLSKWNRGPRATAVSWRTSTRPDNRGCSLLTRAYCKLCHYQKCSVGRSGSTDAISSADQTTRDQGRGPRVE